MHEIPQHCPMPLNAAGEGPELDPDLVVDTICWCGEDAWPCPRETPPASKWCPECKRLIGIGCACGLTFAQKAKALGLSVPRGFGYR